MSTYYQYRCPDCREQGGFFSRQAWGWGNCDIFMNFKFHVAHVECSALEILSEHDDQYADTEEEMRWLERLEADEHLRQEVWPRTEEWGHVAKSWEKSHAKWEHTFLETLEREREQRAAGA